MGLVSLFNLSSNFKFQTEFDYTTKGYQFKTIFTNEVGETIGEYNVIENYLLNII